MIDYINTTEKDLNENSVGNKRAIDTVEELKTLNNNPNLNEKNVIELLSKIVPLITKSSNVNYQYNDSIKFGIYLFPAFCTLLHIAARFNCNKIAECLIKAGADVNPEDKVLCTPLHHAAINGNIEVVQVLVATNRAGINAPNQWHKTSLEHALEEGHLKVAEFLISKGADQTCVPAYITKKSQEKGKKSAFIVAGISSIAIQLVLNYGTELSVYAIIGATIASMVLTGGIAFGFAYMWKKHELSSMLTEVELDNTFSAERFKLYID